MELRMCGITAMRACIEEKEYLWKKIKKNLNYI